MTNLATSYLAFLPLVSRVGQDARVLPIVGQIDFSKDVIFALDLTAAVQSAQLRNAIQSVHIDTSQVPIGSTVMQVFGTGQLITVPAQTQGYYPLLVTQTSFIFTLQNGSCLNLGVKAPVSIFFMNVPFVSSQWDTASATSGGYGVGGLGGNPLGQ